MGTVTLRPMRGSDLPLLTGWLAQPHVRRWWAGEPQGLEAVGAKYRPCIDGEDPTELFVIEETGRPIGMTQRYRIADHPEWASVLEGIVEPEDAAGIDYLIGEPDAIGRGMGTSAIGAFVPGVFARYRAAAIVASVQQAILASPRTVRVRPGLVRPARLSRPVGCGPRVHLPPPAHRPARLVAHGSCTPRGQTVVPMDGSRSPSLSSCGPMPARGRVAAGVERLVGHAASHPAAHLLVGCGHRPRRGPGVLSTG